MSEPQLIDIERLHVKAEWRPRSGGLNIGHVQSLRDSDASDWPPLVVTPDSQHEGDYLVVDGHHRREAGILEQIAALQCIVEETGGLLEALPTYATSSTN